MNQRALQEGTKSRFEGQCAFITADLAAVTPKPTLGVVSGLYELFGKPSAARFCRAKGGERKAAVILSTPVSRGTRR